MKLRSDRYRSSTAWGRALAALLTLLLFVLLTLLCVSGYALYTALSPGPGGPPLVTERLLGNPSEVEFTLAGGEIRKGLFYPGRRGAPTIILCHGYGSRVVEVLTLAAGLQENRFNVFLFDFSGHGQAGGRTTLGYREAAELRAALDTIARRDDVHPQRFGVWGADMGAYAALAAAAEEPRIRAIVADSSYDAPADLLRLQVRRTGLHVVPLVDRLTQWGFQLYTWPHRATPPLHQRLGTLEGVPKLFLAPYDNVPLSESTLELHDAAPEPRRQEIVEKGSYVSMLDVDKRPYENRVISFFLQHLSPATWNQP